MRKHSFLYRCLSLTLALALTTAPTASAQTQNQSSSSSEIDIELQDPAAYIQGNATELLGQETASDNLISPGNTRTTKGDTETTTETTKDFTSVSPFTKATYTHSGVFEGMNIYHGIDVSYHQGAIDWAKVKAAGVDFAIVRMGFRGYANGNLATDMRFKENVQGAIDAGLKVGVYFFTEAISVDEAVAEAQYVLDAISPYNITMPVAIDWESNAAASDGGRKITAGLTKEQNTLICSAFCDVIKSAGYTPMVYANKSDFSNRLDGEALSQKYEIWLARYNKIAEFQHAYSFWQYSAGSATNTGTVDGISGNVDLNFWYTSSTIDNPSFTHSSTNSAIVATPAPTQNPEEENIGNIENLTAVSAAKNITLSWDEVSNADGYEIRRKDTYNGSFKKVKTITEKGTTSWKNTKLSKKHEYYYKIRAYRTVDGEKEYSEYAKLTAATKPSDQVAIAKKYLKIVKKPAKNAKTLITVSKGISLHYLGQTHLKNGKKFLHVQYITTSKTYDGYLPVKSSLKYYTRGTTTAVLNLRKTAGMSGKLLTSIPKGTPIAIMGKKTVTGTIWYKTSYSGKNGIVYNGYVSSDYVK